MQRGFTLIEVLIVISVVGILALTALPTLGQSVAQSELDNTARVVAAEIRLLQQSSRNITGNSAFPELKFYKAKPYGYYIQQSATITKSYYFPDSVVLQSAPTTIRFNSQGISNPVSNVMFGSTTISRKNRYIIIHPITGRVRVDDKPATE